MFLLITLSQLANVRFQVFLFQNVLATVLHMGAAILEKPNRHTFGLKNVSPLTLKCAQPVLNKWDINSHVTHILTYVEIHEGDPQLLISLISTP